MARTDDNTRPTATRVFMMVSINSGSFNNKA